MNRGVPRCIDLLRKRIGPSPAELGQLLRKLPVQVPPFVQTQERYEMSTALGQQLAVGPLRRQGFVEKLPKSNEAQKIRALVPKAQMRLICRLLLLQRALSRVRHGERARDDEHLGKATGVPGRNDHAADTRIDGQLRELAAERGYRVARIHRSELLQQLIAVGDGARAGRIEKWKRIDRAKLESRHAQDHGCERRAQDLRVGEARSCGEVFFAVKPYADARSDATASPRALISGGSRDLLDLQQADLVAQRVATHTREARVNDVADARDGQRGLGNVCRQHDAPPLAAGEYPLLLLGRQPRIQREDLHGVRVWASRKSSCEQFLRLADFALTGQKNQYVPGSLAPQLFDRADDRLFERF